jgi:ABC-type transporter Mla MlaB component
MTSGRGSGLTPMVAFAIHGPLLRADLPGLYARVCRQLGAAPGPVVVCDVTGVEADAVAIEALARLQLGARRHGCRVQLSGASPELCALIDLLGLTDVLSRDAVAARRAGRASRSPGRT